MDSGSTLEKAVKTTRQSELAKKQQSVVRGTEGSTVTPKTVEAVHKGGCVKRKGPALAKNKSENTQSSTQSSKKCERCDKSPSHAHSMCSAKDTKCLKCKKGGITKSCVDLEEQKSMLYKTVMAVTRSLVL